MKLDRVIRIAIAVVVVGVFVVATGALLFITESALNVWDRLQSGPKLLLYGYVAVMVLLVVTAIGLIWRLVVKRRVVPKKKPSRLTQKEIKSRLDEAAAAGVDVAAAEAELKVLAEQQADGRIQLCFFGEISSGKSSLIKALVPDAEVTVDVIGGSTDSIRHYHWDNDGDRTIVLTDVPGSGGDEDRLDQLARDEALRAHLVLFVCDGDLTRSELQAVKRLIELEKPMILVLNKADQFNADEQAALMYKLLQRIEVAGGEIGRNHVVAVTAGGSAEVIEVSSDGREQTSVRHRAANVGVLLVAINQLLSNDVKSLDAKRERAIFHLAKERLESAEAAYRLQRSEQIIRSSTRKAIVGALAAVSPGTDVLIQGYIGTTMTQQLCGLYGAAPRDLDVEEFLDMSQSRVGKALPLSLAVAGNGLKAFPGLGTVAGGLVHAVAYGLIFDALGRSLILTLTKHGELVPETAANVFEEGISEHLEASVRRVAKMALDEKSAK